MTSLQQVYPKWNKPQAKPQPPLTQSVKSVPTQHAQPQSLMTMDLSDELKIYIAMVMIISMIVKNIGDMLKV